MDAAPAFPDTYLLDEENANELVYQLLSIGQALYRYGAEISRIENTLCRVGKAYGAEHINVYAITSTIVITAYFGDEITVTQSRRITLRGSMDLARIEELNSLCRSCAKDPISISELKKRVDGIIKTKKSSVPVYIGEFIAASAFTVFFGGEWYDGIASIAATAVIVLLQIFLQPLCNGYVYFNFIASFVTGAAVTGLSYIFPGIHPDMIVIGNIMLLIPGIAITNSLRLIISGDKVSGLETLTDSILQAAAIAAGFILAFWLFR